MGAKISIIVPVYNTKEEYLRACIESVQNQTLQDIQIILVEYGATDQLGSICDEYQRQDSRIITIHQADQGSAIARNNGLKLANGEWIVFVDSDDLCAPEMCEKIYLEANRVVPDILIFPNFVLRENGHVDCNQFFATSIERFDEKLKQEAELKTMVLHHPTFSFQPKFHMMGTTWCKLIRREFLQQTGLEFEPKLLHSQDIIFYLNLFEQAQHLCYLDEPLYYYRAMSQSGFTRYRPHVDRIFEMVLQKQQEFIETYQKPEVFREVFLRSVMQSVGVCTATDFAHQENPQTFRERCRGVSQMVRRPVFRKGIQSGSYEGLNATQKVAKLLLKCHMEPLYLLAFPMDTVFQKRKRMKE